MALLLVPGKSQRWVSSDRSKLKSLGNIRLLVCVATVYLRETPAILGQGGSFFSPVGAGLGCDTPGFWAGIGSQWPIRDVLYCFICWYTFLSKLLCNELCVSSLMIRTRQKAAPEKKYFESGRIQDSLMPSSAGWITNHLATVFVIRLFSIFLATDLWDHFAIFSCLWLGTFLLGTCWVGRSAYPELLVRGWTDPAHPVNDTHFMCSLPPLSISSSEQQQFWKYLPGCSSKTQENKMYKGKV